MKKLEVWFLSSSAVILFVAALFVLLASASGGRVLELPDPLLSLSLRWVFRLVGGALLGVSWFLLWSRNVQARLALLAWISFSALLYLFGMIWYGAGNLFASLGNLNVGVSIRPAVLSPTIGILLIWLLAGSGGLLIFELVKQWRNRKAKHPRPSVANHPRQAVCPS